MHIDIVNKKLYNEYDKTGYNKSGRSCYYGEYKYQYPYGCRFEAVSYTHLDVYKRQDLKRQFEAFCADMGMTMTTAFNVFARKAVREYRIPFEISGAVPNAETVEAIQAVKRMKADPSLGLSLIHI